MDQGRTKINKPQGRGRGRPRKENAGDDDHLKIRRERNRQNQLAFRTRRQETLYSQELQIARLEKTIEQMSSALVSLADDMLGSDAVTSDAGLVQKLGKTMEHVVSLTRKSAEDAAAETGPEPEPEPEEVQQDITSTVQPVVGLPSGVFPTPASLVDVQDPAGYPFPFIPHEFETPIPSTSAFVPQAAAFPDIPPNIFGNGWFDTSPVFQSYQATHPNPPPQSAYPFSFQLVRTSMQILYAALAELRDAPYTAARLAGFSLRYHSRADLLFNVRWFLGPGHLEMHRLGHGVIASTFVEQVFAAARARTKIGELDPAIDVDIMAEMVQAPGMDDGDEPFLNARGVELYLRDKGFRYIGSDVMEMPAPATQWLHPGAFFPDTADQGLGEGLGSVYVSRDLLIRNLVGISMCMANAPGYRRRLMDGAIEASIIRGGR